MMMIVNVGNEIGSQDLGEYESRLTCAVVPEDIKNTDKGYVCPSRTYANRCQRIGRGVSNADVIHMAHPCVGAH